MYPWIVTLHLLAMVAWFAALFYLPRLFVYHAQARDRGDEQAIDYFKVMERKLYRGIMTPSMLAVLVFGGWILYLAPGFLGKGWLLAKLLLVAALIGYHHICLAYMKRLATGTCGKSERFFRVFNEVPTIALVLILILAVVRPF
ncbi:protoporphyrinogen oxidase HemJ [Halomonas sp. HP20-15]|uniref:protoporphyrinogen oxidase HemJ n=1 Tax=Halomonas sp. HP20-15 TaxID=3085901 RepID=UPI002982286B|nr:protoporphyrinogen oxidase HemJ [Halomonas sp. HP20-15]MDW5375916.1 protoporphyrinogen oxidase HemJ [Halomonas sp. HP20-15]